MHADGDILNINTCMLINGIGVAEGASLNFCHTEVDLKWLTFQ